jgi:hypothetical protein
MVMHHIERQHDPAYPARHVVAPAGIAVLVGATAYT